MSQAIRSEEFGQSMSPKHAKRVTVDGAHTSLNFKEVEELGDDFGSMMPSQSNASK